MTSWEFFDYLLSEANVVGTPGSGFGPSGEGYFRLTAFNTYENTVEAVERMKSAEEVIQCAQGKKQAAVKQTFVFHKPFNERNRLRKQAVERVRRGIREYKI